jgi:ATP-dependent exoDNAse (exonuclease V) alpha subunit
LSALSGREFVYRATVSGTFDPKSFPTDTELRLKVGATVMLLRNDPEKRWVNGDIGIVHALDDDEITVDLSGKRYPIQRAGWEKIAYDFDRGENRITENVVGQFEQFPVRLAWAITIHKSQGQTFERAEINLGNRAFAHGQVYVALSRCKSLHGIAMPRPMCAADIIVDRDVHRMGELLNRTSDAVTGVL